MAGCGSAPPAPVAQTFERPVVNFYDSNNSRGVDADGNLETTIDQKHIYMYQKSFDNHPELAVKDPSPVVRFQWNSNDEKYGVGTYEES
jgi:hypothetical protein